MLSERRGQQHKPPHQPEGSGLASCLGNCSSPGASFSPDLCGLGSPLISPFLTQASGKPRPRGQCCLVPELWFLRGLLFGGPGSKNNELWTKARTGSQAISFPSLPSAPPIWDRGLAPSWELEGAWPSALGSGTRGRSHAASQLPQAA